MWEKRQQHWIERKTVYLFQVTHATEKFIGFKAWVFNLSKPEGTMSEIVGLLNMYLWNISLYSKIIILG